MSDPERAKPVNCQHCDRVFEWGVDADSAIVDAQDPWWRPFRESALWKRNFHIATEHPEMGFVCPRRVETLGQFVNEDIDEWLVRSARRTCSYCGSLQPDELFRAIEEGHEIGPTDKSYKAYVRVPNPAAGEQVVVRREQGPAFDPMTGKLRRDDLTDEEKERGSYEREVMGSAPDIVQLKFYFQHLSTDQREKFVDLLNQGKINIGAPGYFYTLPYFCVRQDPGSLH